MNTRRLLVISHAAVTPVNLAPYACLCHAGWDVSVVVPARWRSEWGGPARRPSGDGFPGTLLPLPTSLSGNIPLHHYAAAALGRLLDRIRPGVLYIEEEPYAWVTHQAARLAWARGIPFAVYAAQNLAKTYPRPVAQRESWVLTHAAACVAITADVAGVLRHKGRTGPVFEVPLWVAPHAALPPASPGDGGPLRVGYAGRLVPEKGVDILVAGFAASGLDAVLEIAGSGPLLPALRRLAARWRATGGPRLALVGALPHTGVQRFCAGLDVLVLPSRDTPRWSEQFGRVIVEAGHVGVPTIGARAGWIPRLVAELDGDCFEQGDVPGLADALRRMRAARSAPDWDARRAARARAARRYRVERVAAELAGVLDAVVGGAAGA